MKTLIKSHPIWSYVILAYSISWLIQLPELIAMQGSYHFTGRYLLLLNVASYGPSIAAIIVITVLEGWTSVQSLIKRLFQWRVSLLVYLATFFIFPLVFFIGYQVLGISASENETLLVFLTLVVAVPINSVIASVVFGIGPLGEELGWRGFMLPRLLERYGDFHSSFILGLVWAFWHLPVFLFPEWRGDIPITLSIILYPFGTVAIAYIMTKLHHWSQGSVLIAILFHGVVNYIADSQEYWLIDSFSPLMVRIAITGLFIVTAFVFWIFSTKTVQRQSLPAVD
ncbi:MAG: CPBP family intramembrane metalloprotease [Anaerolineales bacterium]|nr:CPBP family intramembrane metalloprotease [Anaerolineales bacterium]